MAALSFSPSPPPPTPNGQTGNRSALASKENAHCSTAQVHVKSAVTTMGASKPFAKITVNSVLSESGANALQQHINNQNTIIRKIKDFGIAAAAAAANTSATSIMPRKRPLGVSKSQNEQNKATPAGSKRSKLVKRNDNQIQSQNQEKLPSNKLKGLPSATATAAAAAVATLELVTRPAGTPGRKGLPLPQAVARRNARERNRVKQVNNGFAALRERIPEEVSEVFEAQGAGRGASKKLSKVETLRMAVEYIRSLERLLGFDFPPLGCSNSNSSSSGDDSFMFIKDEFDGLDEQFDDSLSNYEELDESIGIHLQTEQQQQQLEQQQQQQLGQQQKQQELELLPSVTTLNGLQYVRIAGTNTYQLLTPDMLGTQDSSSLDEEQFNALIDTNCLNNSSIAAAAAAAASSNSECAKFDSSLSRSPVPTAVVATTGTATTSRSASPTTTMRTTTIHGSPSLHQPPEVAVAVSPVADAVANELLLQACAAQQQQQQHQRQHQQLIKQEYGEGDFIHVNNNNNNNSSPPAIDNNSNYQHQQHAQQQPLLCSPTLPAFYDQETNSFYDNVVVSLPSFKKEFPDVLQDQSTNTIGGCLSDESMIDAIDWWEAHTPKSDSGTIPGM